MKQVCCRDLGNDCDFTVSGDVEEVMAAVAAHAEQFHKIVLNEEVVEAVKGVMKEV
jgi:predicted small metal-binding protein